MAGQLWVRLIRRNRTIQSITEPCAPGEWQEALDAICHQLDLSRPLVLGRHMRDWQTFGQTRFLREHFIDKVEFDSMELEYIDPDAQKGKAERNHEPD